MRHFGGGCHLGESENRGSRSKLNRFQAWIRAWSIDPLKLNQLNDELEVEDFLRESSLLIVPDINLLVYAYNEERPSHSVRPRKWWQNN